MSDDASDLRDLLIQLDMALTGKPRHAAEHTARGQTLDPLSDRIYYLSDGGYSRIGLNDSEWPHCQLFVASESLERVKVAWSRPDVQALAAAIAATIRKKYE